LLACVPLGAIDTWTFLPVAIGAAAVIAWLATTNTRAVAVRILASAPLVGLGRISYGVYLWHLPLAVALTDVLPPWQVAAWTIAISIAIAGLVWKFVERPVLSRAEPWPRMKAHATSRSDDTLSHTAGQESRAPI
jgi:peptidoglycan/LPS O-acetylase OafA/YrhL